jgi:subfamily B ATP-binding cassette protein MsbA
MGRIFRDYLKPHLSSFLTAMACAAVVGALSAALAARLEPMVRLGIERRDPHALWFVPLTIVAIGLVRGACQLIQAVLTNRVGNQLVAEIQVQLFGHFVRSDLARLRTTHTGAYVSSVLYDAGLVREAATSGVVNYTQYLVTTIACAAVMVFEDPMLAGLLLVIAPIVALVMRHFVDRTRDAANLAMDETSALSTAVMESLDGIKIVKIETREADEEARVAEVIGRRLGHLIRGANAKALAGPATDTLMTVAMAAILVFAGWRALGGRPEVSRLLAFITALAMGAQAIRFVANYQPILTEGLAAAQRMFRTLDEPPTIVDRPGAKSIERSKGALKLDKVSFAYDRGADVALDQVSLEAKPGQTVALVGPSGGGKSTILSLIPRFYEADAGAISLDGVDIRDLTLKSLRAQIALVTQEPFLFDDSIRANIAYSRPGASEAEIVAAAQAAAADEFILQIPGGYGAQVGEAGARLSGGQRQRIAIARAFLKDAPLILLDEATSALDVESEAKVQQALEHLMAGRTTLLIAHRLSTVRRADVIYVIDRGRVVETGTHESLSALGGLYARLAKSQDLEVEPA